MFLSLTDLITLTELLCITPSVREAFTAMARGCHKGQDASWSLFMVYHMVYSICLSVENPE